MFETPVLLIIFNRPDTTRVVFDKIKEIKPKYLFIAADGPRLDKIDEKEKCLMTREIIKEIDWDCELKTLFREENLGCRLGVSSAIDWFFGNVEEGIILEDDCLPNDSFFKFCANLLKHYRYDERVMHISGDNFQDGIKRGNGSYYFSKFNHVWGWATWRRAWDLYDLEMKTFLKFKSLNLIQNVWPDKIRQNYWLKIFELAYQKKINTWDYQWEYAILKNNGLCILPNYNLVSNIGFGSEATHTKNSSSLANMKTEELTEIIHPNFLLVDDKADLYSFKKIFSQNVFVKIFNRLKFLN